MDDKKPVYGEEKARPAQTTGEVAKSNVGQKGECDHIADPFLKAECEREVTLRGNETAAQKNARMEAEKNGTTLTAEQRAQANIDRVKKEGAPENKMAKPDEEIKTDGKGN